MADALRRVLLLAPLTLPDGARAEGAVLDLPAEMANPLISAGRAAAVGADMPLGDGAAGLPVEDMGEE
jgi:hypothetical protein